MIQRIQSLYLLLGATFLGLFLATSTDTHGEVLNALTWALPAANIVAGLTAFVALLAIFLYKNRAQQAKVIMGALWLDLLLVLIMAGAMGYISFQAGGAVTPIGLSGYGVLLLPIVAYACLRLAQRSVKKDIDLVRSMDRLR